MDSHCDLLSVLHSWVRAAATRFTRSSWIIDTFLCCTWASDPLPLFLFPFSCFFKLLFTSMFWPPSWPCHNIASSHFIGLCRHHLISASFTWEPKTMCWKIWKKQKFCHLHNNKTGLDQLKSRLSWTKLTRKSKGRRRWPCRLSVDLIQVLYADASMEENMQEYSE